MQRQSGVTLLIVLVVVALATLVAAQLIEHTTYSERRTTLMLSRDQAYQLALGGEALASLWLSKGFDKESDTVHLNQPWATTPFQFPIEGGMINGTVIDAQSCFNLNSLHPEAEENQSSGGTPAPGGGSPRVDPNAGTRTGGQPPGTGKDKDHLLFEQLINEVLKQSEIIDVTPESLSAPVIDWIDNDIKPLPIYGAEDMLYTGFEVPYRTANSPFASASELRVVKGYSAKIYRAMKDLVCVLPDINVNKINVNTVLPENAAVLAAVTGMSLSNAQEILGNIPEEGYDMSSFKQQLGNDNRIDTSRIDFTSQHFLISIEVDFKGAKFRMKSLVKRESSQGDAPFRVVTRYFGEF